MTDLTEEEYIYYALFCKFSPNIGNARAIKILSSPDKIVGLDLKNPAIIKKVQTEITKARDKNVTITTYFSETYPKNLRHIHNPPVILYYKGIIHHPFCFAIVGTRNPSEYGYRAGSIIIRELCREGATLVSGFAKGIDTIAHQISIDMLRPTIAVLGCGIDVDYPKSHSKLKDTIISKGGGIISEFGFGVPPLSHHFPVRNRIISGLSEGIFVAEAHEKSGSLITAKLGIEQGKNVYTMPGLILDKKFQGNHHLIRMGGILVENAYQILEEYPQYEYLKGKEYKLEDPSLDDVDLSFLDCPKNKKSESSFTDNEAEKLIAINNSYSFHSEGEVKMTKAIKEQKIIGLSQKEVIVYYALSEKQPLEVIMSRSSLSASSTLAILTLLSLKGLVVEEKGLYHAV